MDLSDYHKLQLQKFLTFFKGKRERFQKEVNSIKEDVLEERATEDVYAKKDVETILAYFAEQLKSAVKSEQEQNAHVSGAVLSQLFASAQSQHITLESDVGVAEDQKKLAAVEAVGALPAGQLEAAGQQRRVVGALPQLQAGFANDPAVLQELADLKEENRKKEDRMKQLTIQMTDLLKERTSLNSELEKVKTSFKTLKKKVKEQETTQPAIAPEEFEHLERALNEAKRSVEDKEQALTALQQEQNKRLSESSQVQQLKQMLTKKNEEIKQLRTRLGQYEKDDAVVEEDD